MNTATEQTLVSRIKTLSKQQVAEVEDFIEFLANKSKKQAALSRLLAIVPALETAGAATISDEDIAAEIKAARAKRHATSAND